MLQIIIIILSVVADQISKIAITGWLMPGESYPLINNVLHFTYVRNTGMAMGLFQNSTLPLIIITSLILIAGLVFMIRERGTKSLLFKISLALIVGGAIGNLIDRIFRMFVVDFVDLRFIKFFPFIFNVSDACITIGAVLLAIYLLFYHDKYKLMTLKENNEQ